MHAMLKRTALVLVVAVLLTSCTMWNKPASGWTGATGGDKLEQLFWDDVKNNDFRKIEAHVGSTFVGSGPSGPIGRDAFLQQLRSGKVHSVSLSECSSHVNGEDVMITCKLQRDGASASQVSTLSVWQQYKKGWLMVAHSETPLAQ
jgi:hypothetical protein